VPEILQFGKHGNETILQIVFRLTFIPGVPHAYTKHFGSQQVVQLFAGPVIPRNTSINYFAEVFQTGFNFSSKVKIITGDYSLLTNSGQLTGRSLFSLMQIPGKMLRRFLFFIFYFFTQHFSRQNVLSKRKVV